MNNVLRLSITEKQFMMLYSLAAEYKDSDERAKELWDICEDKLDRIIDHDLYAQSKTAATPEEREKAKNEYWQRRREKF